MSKIEAIVRGPEPYFDGESLFAPGEIVLVEAEFVSDQDTIEREIDYELPQPVLNQAGELVTSAKRKIKARTKFRPIEGRAIAASPLDTAQVATATPDRLNVADFLKGGTDQVVAAIANGTVDDFLAAIEQQEIAKRGPVRKEITAAIAARNASLRR